MSLKTSYSKGHVLTKDEVFSILKAACDGLSHASYAEITGCRVSRAAIEPAWGDLSFLLESLKPEGYVSYQNNNEEFRVCDIFDEDKVKPALQIEPFEA